MKTITSQIVLCFYIFILLPGAYANSCKSVFHDLSTILAVEFHASYHLHYNRDYCGENVVRFIYNLNRSYPHISTAKLNILFITTPFISHVAHSTIEKKFFIESFFKDRLYSINMENRRPLPKRAIIEEGTDPTPPWRFHVVLEYDGMVYDFDYSEQPTPIPLKQYFSQIYRNSSGSSFEVQNGEVIYFSHPAATANELLDLDLYSIVKKLEETQPSTSSSNGNHTH